MATHVSHEWSAEFNGMQVMSLCPGCQQFKEGVMKRAPHGLVRCAECARPREKESS